MKKPTSGQIGEQRITFFAAPFKAPLRPYAAVVIPWLDDHVVLCNIAFRGWCVPSGRLEVGETSLDAARREAREEACVDLENVEYIGCYQVSERNAIRWADLYTATVPQLNPFRPTEESTERATIERCSLQQRYYDWAPVLETVFEHAWEVMRRGREAGVEPR